MDKFRNQYRIPSTRLQHWDYGTNGAYFITICTKNREHYFGNITNDEMQLNELGQLANQYWSEIPEHFSFVELGNFVVMPNHIHGILIIDKNANVPVETRLIASLPPATASLPSQTAIPSQKITGGFAGLKNPMVHENISRIARWYKGRPSFEMRQFRTDFVWQSRFHDHIIRDAQSFENIQNYISNNPMNWKQDTFFA